MIPLAVLAFVLLLFVEEKPLATRVDLSTGEISTVEATATEAQAAVGASDRPAESPRQPGTVTDSAASEFPRTRETSQASAATQTAARPPRRGRRGGRPAPRPRA